MDHPDREQRLVTRGLDFMMEVIRNPDAYPDSFISLPMDAEVIRKVLTEQRTRLIRYLEKYGPAGSVQELAAALHRKEPAISRDLRYLVEIGLVEAKRVGKTKRIRATGRPILIH